MIPLPYLHYKSITLLQCHYSHYNTPDALPPSIHLTKDSRLSSTLPSTSAALTKPSSCLQPQQKQSQPGCLSHVARPKESPAQQKRSCPSCPLRAGLILCYICVLVDMDIKIKREELMAVMQKLRVVEELPREALQEYSRLMKVKQGDGDHPSLVAGLQERVADIFCQEGQAFEDYLQLPKFRSMSPPLQDHLNRIFKTVWQQCHHSRQQQHLLNVRKQVEQMTVALKTPAESQHFHLSLLKLFRESPLCPRPRQRPSSNQDNRMLPEHNNFPSSGLAAQVENHRVHQVAPQGFPGFPLQAGSYPKMQPQQGSGYIMEKEPQQHQLFEVPRFPMQPHFFPDFYSGGQMAFQEQMGMPYPPQMPPQQQTIKNSFGEESAGLLARKFRAYEFVQCVCEGREGIEGSQSFRCSGCQFRYHFACLRIDKAAKEEAICPICNLRKETLFCKVVQEPIKFVWHLQEKNQNQFKLEMTEEESLQIIESKQNGLECQVRFLKIDGRTLRRERRTMEGFVTEGRIIHKQLKHSEITLPEFNPENPQPISLDVLLRSQDEPNPSPKLYFFSVFLVILRKVDEIVTELFQSSNFVNEAYLSQFIGESGKVEAKFFESSVVKGLMKYPVRGSQCRHPDVFDYEKFLELINDLKQDRETELLCPICSAVCPSFKFDAFILRKISQQPNYDRMKPVGLEVDRSGSSSWVSSDLPVFTFRENVPEDNGFMQQESQQNRARQEE